LTVESAVEPTTDPGSPSAFDVDEFNFIWVFAMAAGTAFHSEMGEVCASRDIDLGPDLP
jgi:hypothetical protein